MNETPIRIATRGSDLALAQARIVLLHCQSLFPDLTFELKVVKTTGDKLQMASLTSANLPKGLFTKELETALLNNQAALAVHSLKDLPTELPQGLILGAVLEREDVRDVLVYRDARQGESPGRSFPRLSSLNNLPHGATLATSSTRRAAQARHIRPDLRILPIRGNVPTRLAKLMAQGELDALVLAAAGINRLGYAMTDDGALQLSPRNPAAGLMATLLSLEEMLPCVGQGAIAIETRQDDNGASRLCAGLDHAQTHQCVAAERALLRALGGGCQLPLGAHARRLDDQLCLQAISFLGPTPRRAEALGNPANPDALGRHVGKLLM